MGAGGARVTVLVADDHPIYREGMARAITQRPDLQLLAECADGAEVLAEIDAQRPDVVVLDLAMPGIDGMQVLAAMQSRADRPHLLILSAEADSATIYETVSLGAAGYLRKDASRPRICDAIAAVARGETVLGAELSSGLADEIRSRRNDDRPLLTDRETEILRLTADGQSRADIAQRLHLSPTTVKTHMEHAYGKLGVSDRAAAVAAALRRGVLT